MKPKILVVDDDEAILELVTYNLVKNGYDVVPLEDGLNVMSRIEEDGPDLILLDRMLPETDGLQLCQSVKERYPHMPIIVFSARGEDDDIIEGLNRGADDYVPKPFSVPVLLARIKTRIKTRQGKNRSQQVVRGELWMDLSKYKARIGTVDLKLTRYEFKLLALLAQHPGWLFDRHHILESLEGREVHSMSMDRTVDVHVAAIRKKLRPHSDYIETVRGMGYRFREIESDPEARSTENLASSVKP